MRYFLKYILAMTVACFYHPLPAQQKAGYIEYDKVIHYLPLYSKVTESLEKYKELFKDTLNQKLSRFTSFITKNSDGCHGCVLTTSQIKFLQDTLFYLQKDISEYQILAHDKIKMRKEFFECQVKISLYGELSKFCKMNVIPAIVDRKRILFCNDCVDYSDDFVTFETDMVK